MPSGVLLLFIRRLVGLVWVEVWRPRLGASLGASMGAFLAAFGALGALATRPPMTLS